MLRLVARIGNEPSSFASVLSEAIRQGHGQAACHSLRLVYQELRRRALVWKSILQYHSSLADSHHGWFGVE
jgi:hypothetical protein